MMGNGNTLYSRETLNIAQCTLVLKCSFSCINYYETTNFTLGKALTLVLGDTDRKEVCLQTLWYNSSEMQQVLQRQV